MNIIEKTNRQTERLNNIFKVLMKAKERLGEAKFNTVMEEVAKKSWEN